MFVKVTLILICVTLFNVSEVNSDCDDIVICLGDWVGGLFTDDSKNDTIKTKEAPDVISAVGDLLSDISQLIEDTFKIKKESNLTKNVGNKTEIHIQTFTVNDVLFGNYGALINNDKKIPNAIDRSSSPVNDTSEVSENVFIDVTLDLKENNTETAHDQKGNENTKSYTKMSIDLMNAEIVTTTDSLKHNTYHNNTDNILMTLDDSIKMALSEEYLNNKSILPEISNENTGYDDLNFTTVDIDHINVTYESPLRLTDTFINKTLNIENQNASKIFINIPETVASNYKITFESPINVTYFEINTNENVTARNLTGISVNTTNLSKENKAIENQNVEENEIIDSEYEFDDVVVDDNTTDYLGIDYIDLYKDTTNEDVEYTPPTYIPTTTEAIQPSVEVNETNGIYSVYPWIATVFIKNSDNNQFEYICDGVLLSNRVVLTAARCVLKENVTVDAENILVILGKRSLQETGPNEKVIRVKSVKLHENFTAAEGKVDNDLAIIVLAEPVTFNDDIQPVPLKSDDGVDAIQTATTGWHVTGRLTPIYFEKDSKTCKKNTEALGTFCAVFGDDITTCPSYGGLFVARQAGDEWNFHGVAAGSPTSRGACFNKNVTFTNVRLYHQWFMDNIEMNKV